MVTNVTDVHRYWTCECKPGFYGRTCSLFDCNQRCNWRGECVDKDVCSCFPGFTGDDCSVDCGCGGHGNCNATDNTCICDVGWRRAANGTTCEPDCACASCVAPGECACSPQCVYGDCFHGRCSCYAGYAGPTCETVVPKPNDGSPVGVNLAGLAYW